MHNEPVVAEKALQFNKDCTMVNLARIIILAFSIGLLAQSNPKIEELLVFQPNDNSVLFNEAYTSNLFFGNFDIKPLINAVPVNYSNVKTIKISVETDAEKTPNVVEMNYNSEGKLTTAKISEKLFGEAISIEYTYSEGLIHKEIIKNKNGTKANTFYYVDDKMIVKTVQDMIDVYRLNGKVLYKESYLKGKPIFQDKILGNCRTTFYMKQSIDKTCYSNFNNELPLILGKFTASEDTKTGKVTLEPQLTRKIILSSDRVYKIMDGDTESYRLTLNSENRIKEFEFLGNQSQKKKPMKFTFSTIYYN